MTKRRKPIDLDNASREELIAYIKRVEARSDQMKKNYKTANDYTARVNEAVRRLATDGSLAFQAMAEKAGVRGHPSVTKVVEFFDKFVGLQWGTDKPPEIDFPDDWDFDADDEWTGDADMQLNAPIAELIDIVESLRFSGSIKPALWEAMQDAVAKVQKTMKTHIDGIKSNHGFTAKHVDVKDAPHGMGWALLDLAQDMSFANHMLRRDLRAAVYRRVCADLYNLSHAEHMDGPSNFEVKVFSGEGQPF